MGPVDAEIDHVDWSAIACPCGQDGEHLADLLRGLLESGTRFDVSSLDGHVMVSSSIYEPAVPAVSVFLAALAGDAATGTREAALEALLFIMSADGQSADAASAGRDLIRECVESTRLGSWLLYAEIFSGRSVDAAGYAFEVLTLIENDAGRLERMRNAASDLLPWDLRA
jgi:hypothetical protein